MPSLHNLNPPPNPFWEFVGSLEDHPIFFNARARRSGPPQADNEPEQSAPAQSEQPQRSEKAQGKQAETEDPPEVDPSTLNRDNPVGGEMPFRGRGRFGAAFDNDDDTPRRGHGCRGRGGFGGRGGHHHHGPPGPPPPWAFHHRGPWWGRRGPGPHHGPPHHHHGPPPHDGPGPDGFNLGEFLNNLGERLGVDLSGAAEGLGLHGFTGPRSNADADFEPRADVFDTPASYLIHVSLPGAKKEDVGVDWDGENSHLRIAGVVHRPGADEQLLSQLVVDGRKRETGVFEKTLRLGTRRDPAAIDISGITAKMADGVLVVKVPKVEVENQKRDVPISAATPSPARADQAATNEKTSLIDADEEMYEAVPSVNEGLKQKEREAAAEAAKEHETRSETMDYEQPEQLPEYTTEEAEEEDWEKAGSDEEGEYVKINVD